MKFFLVLVLVAAAAAELMTLEEQGLFPEMEQVEVADMQGDETHFKKFGHKAAAFAPMNPYAAYAAPAYSYPALHHHAKFHAMKAHKFQHHGFAAPAAAYPAAFAPAYPSFAPAYPAYPHFG